MRTKNLLKIYYNSKVIYEPGPSYKNSDTSITTERSDEQTLLQSTSTPKKSGISDRATAAVASAVLQEL